MIQSMVVGSDRERFFFVRLKTIPWRGGEREERKQEQKNGMNDHQTNRRKEKK